MNRGFFATHRPGKFGQKMNFFASNSCYPTNKMRALTQRCRFLAAKHQQYSHHDGGDEAVFASCPHRDRAKTSGMAKRNEHIHRNDVYDDDEGGLFRQRQSVLNEERTWSSRPLHCERRFMVSHRYGHSVQLSVQPTLLLLGST